MEYLPILLGGDLNCYSMALAFYEVGIYPSVALGQYRLGITSWSRIVRQVIDPRMKTDAGRCEVIREIAARYPEKCPILVGCTDEYCSFLSRERATFPEGYIISAPRVEHARLADKAVFGELCRSHGIKMPETVVLHEGETIPSELPFGYPIVLKPSESEAYWHHPFEGMKKVWFPACCEEACRIAERMRGAGYGGTILLQERLRVRDSDNYVLTAYSDRTGRVVGAGFGRVLLEEHTPTGLGNHAAILTMPLPPIAKKLLWLLEDIGYCGFSNFDFLKPQDDDYHVLEVNLRQGRSNHYLTASGLNPAAMILADLARGEAIPFRVNRPNVFWHSYPARVVYSHLEDGALVRQLKELESRGRAISPMHTEAEKGRLFRSLYVRLHEARMCKRAEQYETE